MDDAARPSSADHALVHLVSWWVTRPWGTREAHDPVIFGCLAEVLPAANRALPLIDAAARLAEEVLAMGPEDGSPSRSLEASVLRARGGRLVAEFHSRRAGDALDVFRKGKPNAA